jgi:putative ABC transport system substrate-binding protein
VLSSFREPIWVAFADETPKARYVEGQNTALEVREAESQQERLPTLAAERVALKPNVIFTSAPSPTLALKKLGTSIPVVFAGLGNVVRLGMVERPERGGGAQYRDPPDSMERADELIE